MPECLNPVVFTSFVWLISLNMFLATGRAEGLNRGERGGDIRPHNSEAGEALITLPSLRLSATKIIGAQLGGNATNVQQHIPRITMVHCAGPAWSQDQNAPLRQKSVLPSFV